MTNIPQDVVGEILQDEKFTIVDVTVDPDTEDTVFIVVHDLHPEDEVRVKLVSNEEDGEDSMVLQFDGPDVYTDEEAKLVLHEVMDVIVKIVENAISEAEAKAEAEAEANGESDPEAEQ